MQPLLRLRGVCVCVCVRAQWGGSERCACVCVRPVGRVWEVCVCVCAHARAQWGGSERCACVCVCPVGRVWEVCVCVHVPAQWGGSSGDPHPLPLCLWPLQTACFLSAGTRYCSGGIRAGPLCLILITARTICLTAMATSASSGAVGLLVNPLQTALCCGARMW